MSTHHVLYQYNRLPFGVSSAPAVFQQLMEQALQWIQGLVWYLDDLLITGRSSQKLQSAVEYLGYRIDAAGPHATTAKIDAI